MSGRSNEQLWVPGSTLDHEYPAASQTELADEFSRINGFDVIGVGTVLGAIREPAEHETIRGIASVDLCEILRDTARSLARTAGNNEFLGNHYPSGFWSSFRDEDDAYKNSVIRTTAQVLMANGEITVSNAHEEKAEILRQWRQHGIYVIANTSTLSGCELPTVEFLGEYYKDCFDGIIFPRNHDGRGSLTKAHALGMAIGELSARGHELDFALHIDDTGHHVKHMATVKPHPKMHSFMPRFELNVELEGAPDVTHANTSIEAFSDADQYIKTQLVDSGHEIHYPDRAQRLANAALLREIYFAE